MPDYYIDRRDIDFNLYELFDSEGLTEFSKYEDFDREAFDMIVTEAFKFAAEKMGPTQASSDQDPCRLVDGKVVISECFREVYQQFVFLHFQT